MSGTIIKTSRAFIQRIGANELIRLVEYANPEVIFPDMIRKFFSEIGYMTMYPYFKTLRIGSVHPFALLLYQDVSGQNLDTNLFPSVTIADTTDSETDDVLSREHSEVMINDVQVAQLAAGVESGEILASAENIARMRAATLNGNKIMVTQHSYKAHHTIDLNIWGDNKDMVSLIYDMLKHFVISNVDGLHNMGIDIKDAISGRRSGDVNVDFGSLLYGANVTVPAIIHTTSMTVDLPVKAIGDIVVDTEKLGSNYELLGGI